MKKRPMPDDFREHAREPVAGLAKRYRTSCTVIRRWRDELGMPRRTNGYRPVAQIATDGTVVKVHDSAYYAAMALGKTAGWKRNIITAADAYPYRTAYGFRWRFVDGRAVL